MKGAAVALHWIARITAVITIAYSTTFLLFYIWKGQVELPNLMRFSCFLTMIVGAVFVFEKPLLGGPIVIAGLIADYIVSAMFFDILPILKVTIPEALCGVTAMGSGYLNQLQPKRKKKPKSGLSVKKRVIRTPED
jgi:hypothetical protein